MNLLKMIKTFDVDCFTNLSVAIAGDGRLAMVSGKRGEIIDVWDPHSGRKMRSLTGLRRDAIALAISPDGQSGLSGDAGGELRLWVLDSGACAAAWEGHKDRISAVAFAPDGRTVVSGSWDRSIKRWDLTTRECLGTFRGHPGGVTGVAISPDGKQLISAGFEAAVRLYDMSGNGEGKDVPGQQSMVMCVAISRDGSRFVAGGNDGILSVGDLPLDKLSILDIQGPISAIALSPNGLIAMCGLDSGEIFVLDLSTSKGNVAATLSGRVRSPSLSMSLSLTADGRYLLAGKAGTVALFQV